MTKLVSILAVSILAAGCAKKEGGGDKETASDQAPPTTKPATPPAAAPAAAPGYTDDRSVALVGKLAGVYEAAGTDCEKLAAGIRQFATDNKDEISAQNAWKATLSADQRGALDTRYANELGLAKKMMPGAQACGDHAGVTSALKVLPLD